MPDMPSSALAAEAVSAIALANIVGDLTRALPLPGATALKVSASCRRLAEISAPRLRSPADVGALSEALIGNVQAAARAAIPADASAVLYEAAALAAFAYPATSSPVLTRAYGLARALAASIEAACLGEAFLAEARTAYPDRRAAAQARARIEAAMERASDRIAATLGQAVLGILSTAARECSAFIVQAATSLRPVIRVEGMRSFPSTALAWALYADPAMAPDLVARNRCGTPLFMPATLEALAPRSS